MLRRDMGTRLWTAGLRAVGTLAHCGLTSPVRQSLKLPGHHVGLAVQGGLLGVRQARSQAWSAARARNSNRTLGRIVSPSQALWTSAPRIVREHAAAGPRAGEIASSMPTLQ